MSKLRWSLTYVVVFLLSASAGALLLPRLSTQSFAGIAKVQWNDSMGTIVKDLSYGDKPLNTYDLYLPADRDRATKLVLYIHAGGFTGGDKADDADIAKYFASRGYVAATINYSLRSQQNPQTVHQMSLEIMRGVDAIVQEAVRRTYRLDGMAIAGGSAGGALAMIYAYRDAHQAPVPVKAVISFVGPASFDPTMWFDFSDGYRSDDTANAGARFVHIITGDEITPAMMRSGAYRQNLVKVSASALVTKNAPPTLAAYGALDKVAPYAASRGLEPALATNGIPHDVLVFPNSGHALNRDREMNEELGHRVTEYLDKYAPLG